MSLVTVSKKKGGRVYHRHFDHDEARRLRAEGWTYQRLAEHYGVSETAVLRVCDSDFRRRFDAKTLEWTRRNKRKPCKGGCGRLVWHVNSERTGYCPTCHGALRAAADVSPTELRCTRCREWKPDSEFHRKATNKARRGRRTECRACGTERRREYRRTHPEVEKRANRKHLEKWREKHMARYIVFQPNGAGFVEVARVDAGSPAHAIEQAADKEGEYVAVPEGKFKVMRVAPVQAFRVVQGEAEDSPELREEKASSALPS